MEIWAGTIASTEGSPILEDLHFLSSRPQVQFEFPSNSRIHFVSFIDINRVPLYLAAGPNLEVETGNESTAQWIEHTLSQSIKRSQDSPGQHGVWWANKTGVAQSQLGVLLQLESDAEERPNIGVRVTEVVIYGVLSAGPHHAPPSPPPSSSPSSGYETAASDSVLEVYALPISSELLYAPVNTNIQSLTPPSPQSDDYKLFAQFLPTQHSPLKKRKRAADLLDNAIKRRKNIQRTGGEGVGLIVTGHFARRSNVQIKKESSESELSLTPTIDASIPLPESLKSGMEASPLENHSRRSSIASVVLNDRVSALNRPPSRKSSTLHRVSSSISVVPGSPILTEPSESMSEDNKLLISRIILAGMRLYGLSRNKDRSLSAATDKHIDMSGEDVELKETDEFKGVYHATYRAASFALRKILKGGGSLEKDIVRIVVDHLLSLFCDDKRTADIAELKATS